MNIYSKIMSVLTKGMLTGAGIFCIFSTLLNCVNVIMRYIFNMPFSFMDELALYFVVILVFLVMPYLELFDDQLCISTILSAVKSVKWRKVLTYIRGVITFGLASIMTVVGYDVMIRSFNRNVITAVLRFPKGILYGLMAICFAISAISWILIMLRKGAYSSGN